MRRLLTFVVVISIIAVGAVYAQAPSLKSQSESSGGKAQAEDARTQAARYIGYYNSIKLTQEQEKIKEEALSSIPAPCCGDKSIATCCCPCNLAKSVWGLSHFLIAKRNYNAQQVSEAVVAWLESTNPGGYTGNACYSGGCNKPFDQNSCGGMDESKIY